MAKKLLALLLSLLLLVPVLAANADDEAEKEAVRKLNVLVIDFLKGKNYKYDFNGDNRFDLTFNLDNSLKSCDVMIRTYYDGISITAWPDFTVKEEYLASAALYVAMVNADIFYGHLILDVSDGSVFVRGFHLAEKTLPGLAEMDVNFHQQLFYLEDFGDGLKAVALDGADPYQAYEQAIAAE